MIDDTSHRCGGCGEPIRDSPRWLCTVCSARWDAAIEAQSSPRRAAADRAENASIAAYRTKS
jgi:hypothetical protein